MNHAYGNASDIPELLRQLYELPQVSSQEEPWFSLWSALAHQGDVYSASFAAVPHVVAALSANPLKASFNYFHFPAWVECCRARASMLVQDDLLWAYKAALEKLPGLVAKASNRPWEEGFLQCALAAIAAAKGKTIIAEAVMELDYQVASEFLVWFMRRDV
ncbi:MAG TPA: hypothetical protein VIM98_09490 [Dyella sp.]